MNKNLIVPIAKDYGDNHTFPYIFSFANNGLLVCLQSIRGLQLDSFDLIYFTLLKKYDDLFDVKTILEMQFKRLGLNNAEVLLLEKGTLSEPETIYQTVKQKKITGGIYIKDADCFFTCEEPVMNSVMVSSLEIERNVNPQDKSYVVIDDSFYITNTIEKKVVSKYFTAGGYYFSDAQEFCSYFEKIGNIKGLYLSHIVYAMLLDKKNFRPIQVENYLDWERTELFEYYENTGEGADDRKLQ